MVDVSPRPPTFQSYALLRESLRSAPPTSLISHLPQTPPRTKPRRSRSSPPSLTRPESKIVPGPTPPCDLEQYLLEDYAYYVPEERGVTSIIEGMGQQEDFRVPATIESVTRLSNKVFTPHFCETLAQYYAGLHEDGAYGPCDAFGALRVADVFSNILNDLLVSPQFRENVSGSGKGSKKTGRAGCGGGTPKGAGSGSHDSPGRGGGGEGSGRGRAGGAGRGGRVGRGRGGRAAGGQGGVGPGTDLFNTLPLTPVIIPPRTTPLRPVKKFNSVDRTTQKLSCHQQATLVSQQVTTRMSSLPRFRYVHTLDDEDLVNGREGTLYHATRLRSLKSFKKTGVNPIPHGNFYSGAPSFNLADTVEQAVSHVLHGRPSARIDGSPTDPIMVLAFRMELQSIFNGKTAYVSMEPVGEFLGAEDAAWVADNFDREGLDAIESVPWDFVVGPFLTPVKQSSGEVRYKISKSWTESGAQLVHVAAVSREAFTLLNRSLVGIFVETETKSET